MKSEDHTVEFCKTMNLQDDKKWCDSSESEDEKKRNEDQEEDEEDVFLPLPPKRASKVRFPPKCTVLVGLKRKLCVDAGIDKGQDTKIFRQGIVLQVGIHMDDRETMYQIQTKGGSGEIVAVKERDVQFANGTPCWFKSSDNTYKAVVIGAQENVAMYDSFGLELFASCLSRGLSYSVQLVSTADIRCRSSGNKIFHGVPPHDVSFRSSETAPKQKDISLQSPSIPAATKDPDSMKGSISLIEPLKPLVSCPPGFDPVEVEVSSNCASDLLQTAASGEKGNQVKAPFSNKEGGEVALSWAKLMNSQTANVPPLLVRTSTDSTASSESPGGTPPWNARVKKAKTLMKLNERPSAADLVVLEKELNGSPSVSDLVELKTKKKTQPKRPNILNRVMFNQPPTTTSTKAKTSRQTHIVKSLRLPSLSFGKQFLIDSISGKNGSRLKALREAHSCTIEFVMEKPEGCMLHELMAKVRGPSLRCISECSLAVEEELFYSVPLPLRGCLLARLGVHNDYREERDGIVRAHNPFRDTSNIMEGHSAVSAGSHLRHIAILKAGPTSKPSQDIIGFEEATQWKLDLKHRFPTCEMDIVNRNDYRYHGFPTLCSHIVLASPRFIEVFDCREELRGRLKRGR